MARPTERQADMIRNARTHPLQRITGELHAAYLAGFSPVTVDRAEAAGWITVDRAEAVYRLTPEGLEVVGDYNGARDMRHMRALATDPAAQRVAEVAALARAIGITIEVDPTSPATIRVDREMFARLVDVFREKGALAGAR